ncbi:hypothetical protein GCM10007304_19690 [Rhodococcoides trifolii]|uniref:Uncharacterized protein n=1 Tax=Rhodococcoides trifolii TaxID=908250 RepID=A0A917FSZ0_9NOCA|nr:hypothetical protein [Rhodococcus trifolii]GGG05610.1 hypothetical protein GCM10007304_19690 [Rhodococcus trifolii]
MSSRLGAAALAVVILAVAVVVLGVTNPVRTARVGTDRLGPDTGQSVDDYVSYAQSTLTGDDGAEHWALVSLRSDSTTDGVAAVMGDTRVSQVFVHVAIDRVQTPVVVVSVSAHPVSLANAVRIAAEKVPSAAGSRGEAVAAVTRSRMLADCACVAALLVRDSVPDLRELSAAPAVRAVEALPADAVYGSFSVTPLLPQTVDTSLVQPDDGAVPDR